MKYEVWGRKEKLVDVVADGFEKTISGDLVFYRETKGTTLSSSALVHLSELLGDEVTNQIERTLSTAKRTNVAIFASSSWDSVREVRE